jgi:hypothetical protein
MPRAAIRTERPDATENAHALTVLSTLGVGKSSHERRKARAASVSATPISVDTTFVIQTAASQKLAENAAHTGVVKCWPTASQISPTTVLTTAHAWIKLSGSRPAKKPTIAAANGINLTESPRSPDV